VPQAEQLVPATEYQVPFIWVVEPHKQPKKKKQAGPHKEAASPAPDGRPSVFQRPLPFAAGSASGPVPWPWIPLPPGPPGTCSLDGEACRTALAAGPLSGKEASDAVAKLVSGASVQH
jgi:hypothetical protein